MDDTTIVNRLAADLADREWSEPLERLERYASWLAERDKPVADDDATAQVDALGDSTLGLLAYDIADVMDRTGFPLDIAQDAIERVLIPFLVSALRAQADIDDNDPPEGSA